jgi:hypothetical protein
MGNSDTTARRQASAMVDLVKARKLHDHLECDPQADEFRFGGSAELYYDSILIMVHKSRKKPGMLRFSPVAPPDDAHLVPKGALKGFSAPIDFDVKDVAKKIRQLCRDVKVVYQKYGVTAHLYDDDFSADETVSIDCATDELVFDDDDPNAGEEWKKGRPDDSEKWKSTK